MHPNPHIAITGISSEGGLSIAQKHPQLKVLPLNVSDFLAKLVNAFQEPFRITIIYGTGHNLLLIESPAHLLASCLSQANLAGTQSITSYHLGATFGCDLKIAPKIGW
jgi:hypothetical protein